MKTALLTISLGFAIILSSCGKAAEDREAMHARAKVFQDSIATVIRTSMDEAAAPAPGNPGQVMVAPAAPGATAGQPQPVPNNATPAGVVSTVQAK